MEKRIRIFDLESEVKQLSNAGNARLTEVSEDLTTLENMAAMLRAKMCRPIGTGGSL